VPMQPIHRLACLAQRPDGAAEWACPRCGRYLVNYPDKQVVLAIGAPDTAMSLVAGVRPTARTSQPSATSTSSFYRPMRSPGERDRDVGIAMAGDPLWMTRTLVGRTPYHLELE
jgi:hypothetical protein